MPQPTDVAVSDRSVGDPLLVATCWITAGAAAVMTHDERSPEAFDQRVRAAAEAGFRGFGLLHADLVELRSTIGYDGIRDVLTANGLEVLELEMLVEWFGEGPRRASSDLVRADLLEAAAELGARHIKLGGDYTDDPPPWPTMVREMRVLAAQAADAGTRLAFEPMPFANVKTPKEGLRLIEDVGAPNNGLLLDVWHLGRADVPMASLRDIPVELITHVELDDAVTEIVGTLLEDTWNERRLPGGGQLDVSGFVSSLASIGYAGTWGVEVLSRELRALPMIDAVRAAYDSAMDAYVRAATPA